MTGEAKLVENIEASEPTADTAPSVDQKPLDEQQPDPQAHEEAAGSPGSVQEPEKPADEQTEELSPEEKVLAKLTEQPDPTEGRAEFLRDEDDPENLLNPNDAERKVMGRRNEQRFDHLMDLLKTDRARIAELEPLAEAGRKLQEKLGQNELDAEAAGLVTLASLADTDPAKAVAVAREWIDALVSDHPEIAANEPAMQSAPALYEGELTDDELEAIDLGLVTEDVIRRGRFVPKVDSQAKPEAKAKDEPEPNQQEIEEQELEQQQLPEPTQADVNTGQLIAAALMGAGVEPANVFTVHEQLLPVISEILHSNPKKYPDPLNVPNSVKPQIAAEAYRLFRQREAEEADREPKQPKDPAKPLQRGGSSTGPGRSSAVAEQFGETAGAVFEKLTS